MFEGEKSRPMSSSPITVYKRSKYTVVQISNFLPHQIENASAMVHENIRRNRSLKFSPVTNTMPTPVQTIPRSHPVFLHDTKTTQNKYGRRIWRRSLGSPTTTAHATTRPSTPICPRKHMSSYEIHRRVSPARSPMRTACILYKASVTEKVPFFSRRSEARHRRKSYFTRTSSLHYVCFPCPAPPQARKHFFFFCSASHYN